RGKGVGRGEPGGGGGVGGGRGEVEGVLAGLRQAGVEVTADVTGNSASAAEKARHAVSSGCDTVFACGGDGTIHDVLQGLACSDAALAIIPLGTANALAHDLGVPRNPVAAAPATLRLEPRRVALRRISYRDFDGNSDARYFTVAAGIGADAYMFYRLSSGMKQRLGMAAYYAQATALWLLHKMPFFETRFLTRSGNFEHALVTELLA